MTVHALSEIGHDVRDLHGTDDTDDTDDKGMTDKDVWDEVQKEEWLP